MPLSKEQLLMIRYKVSEEGYPDMIFQPGQIIVLNKVDSEANQPYWLSPKRNHWYQPFFDRFPSIFQKLEWHQDRKVEEMPEYVKVICYPGHGKVIRTANWEFCVFWVCEEFNVKHSYMQDEITPASPEEYRQYLLTQKSKQ